MEVWYFKLRHVAATVQIAGLGTMNAGADAVNLTQTAITQGLGRRGRRVGAPLFGRRHNGMVQTDVARALIPRFAAMQTHIPSPQITTARMRALLALADTGSYAGAAQATGLSLPTLLSLITL